MNIISLMFANCVKERGKIQTQNIFFVDNMNNGACVYTCVYTQSHTRAIRAFCCVAANSVIKNLHSHRMYYGVNVKWILTSTRLTKIEIALVSASVYCKAISIEYVIKESNWNGHLCLMKNENAPYCITKLTIGKMFQRSVH